MFVGIEIYNEIYVPAKYELNLEDGSHMRIELQKNKDYSCPLYCEVDHFHTAVACQARCETDHNNYSFHNFAVQEGTAQFGSKKVLTMSKIKEDKRKIPLVNAERK